MEKVLITGGNGDIAKAIAQALRKAGNYEVQTPGRTELDVTDPASAQQFISEHKPDILINNAGYVVPQSIADCDMETIKTTLDVNLLGTFNCAAAALKCNPDVKIINIGSSAATKVHGTWSAYCAAKAAVVMATKCWAADGNHCVCISPGRTMTKMRKGLYPDEDPNTLMKVDDFAQVVVYAVKGYYPNGAHINVDRSNVQQLIAEKK